MKTRLLPTARLSFALASAIAALLAAPAASAANLTWDNTAGGVINDGAGAWLGAGLWNNSGTPSASWTAGDHAVFGNAGAGGAVTLGSATAVGSLTFNSFTGTYTLGTTTSTITLNTGITKNSGSGIVSVASPITLGAAQTWTNNSTTNLNLTRAVDNGGFLLTIGGTGTTDIHATASVISGSGGLTKNGSGVLVIGGNGTNPAHTYTGTTTVNGGILQVYNIGTTGVPSGNLTINSGVLQDYFGNGGSFTRTLGAGTGQVQILGGASGFSGQGATSTTFTINNSTAFELVWGSAFFNPASLVVQSNNVNANGKVSLTNKIDLAGTTRTIAVNGGDTTGGATLSGVIRTASGTAGLTKTGPGNLILSAANTFNGPTTISGGWLTLTNAAALQNSALDTTNSVAGSATGGLRTTQTTLTLGGLTGDKNFAATGGVFSATTGGYGAVTALTLNPEIGQTPSFSGVIANGAATTSLTKTGLGTQTLAGANTYTGATTVSAGTLVISGSPTANSAMTVNAGGTLQLDYSTNNTTKIHASAILTLGGGTLDLKGGSHPEIVASTTLTAGKASSVTSSTPGSVLQMGTITPGAGASINLGANDIATTANANDASGILGSWATVGGINWAANSGLSGGLITAFTGYADVNAQGPSSTIANLATANVRIFADGTSGTIELGAPATTINSLLQSNATIAATVNTFGTSLAAGAIWIPAGKAALTVGVAANDGFLTAATAGGDLLLQNDSTAVLTINADIVDNTTSTVTKTGTGPLTLNGNNTFAGGLRLNGGALTLGHNNALGTGVLSVNGGSLAASGTVVTTNSVDANGDFSILGTGTLTLGNVLLNANRIITNANPTATTTLGGISGAGRSLTFAGDGNTTVAGSIATTTGALTQNGTGTLTLAGDNTYTGSTNVSSGMVNITGSIVGNTGTSKINVNPATGNAIANYNGGAITSTLFAVTGATVAGTASAFHMTSGALTITPATTTGTQNVAGGVGAYGYYNIADGIFRDAQRFTVTGKGTASATNGTGTGVVAGVIFVGGTGTIDHTYSEWWLNYSLGQVTVADSGKIDRTGSSQPFALFMDHASGVAGGGYGVLNLAGANAQVLLGTQSIRFGNNATVGLGEGQSGFVNLAAGALSVGGNVNTFLPPAPVSINNAYFNFAGGTVKATAALSGWIPASNASINFNSNLFGPIDNSLVVGAPANFTGGLTVDSNTFDVTIGNPLQAPAGVGVTQADLSVSGGSGYVGAPAVIFSSAGVATGGTPAAGYALISGGAITGIVITSPGTYTVGTTPTVTLIGGGGTGAAVTAGALNTANTSGGLTKISDGRLTLSGANTYSGATLVAGGLLQLNGAAATTPPTASLTVNTGGTLGFTAGIASSLDLTGKPVTLGGGTLVFDIGASGTSDALTVGNFTLTADSAFSFIPIGAVPNGGSYTLLTSTTPITTGGFSVTCQPFGKLTFTPTINLNTITVTSSLDEGIWSLPGGGDWSLGNPSATAGNWANYKPTAMGDAALFGSAITGAAAINVDTAHSVGFLRFDNATHAYTIGSGASSNLMLDNGAFAATVTVTSGSHVIAENVVLASNVNVAPATGTTLTVSGNLSGTGMAVQLFDAGTLVLSSTGNSYTGTTSVSAGTLSLTGSLTGGGAITVNGNGVLSESATGVITGATAITHNSSGTSTLAGTNSYTGATAVSAGTLSLTGSLNGGGAITVSGNGVLSQSATGVISGATALTHNSSGTSTLAGLNTYTGQTRVSQGALTLAGGHAASGSIYVADTLGLNATLNITAGTYNLGANEIRAGQITTGATGTVNQSGGSVTFANTAGGAQLVLGGNADNLNVSTGIYNLSGGSLTIPALVNRGILLGSTGNTVGRFVLSGTGVLNMTTASGGNGDANLFIGRPEQAIHVNITASFTQTGGTANIGNLSMGGSALLGPGGTQTLTLTGGTFSANVFSRLAAGNANAATIIIGDAADVTLPAFPAIRGTGATATITFDGGTLKPLAASPTYMGGLTSAFIQDGGAKIDTTNGSITIAQNLLTDPSSTGGGLTKDGGNTLTLTGANTYTGATTVSLGTLALEGGSQASPVTVSSGASLGFTLNSPTTSTSSFNLSAGTIKITGTPTLASYDLITNSSGITGTPVLGPPISGYELKVEGNSLKLKQAGYASWALAKGLDGSNNAKNADPDGDGVNNLAEFAFNGDPLSSSNNGLHATLLQDTVAPAGNELTYIVAVRDGVAFTTSGLSQANTTAVDGLFYTVEGSLDLVFPGSAVSHVGSASDTAPVATGLPDLTGTAWEYHTFRLNASEGVTGEGFLRAKVNE